MTIVASGQLTITDLNDSKQLVSYIGSSQPRIVIFNPTGAGSYTPNYATTNQVLTPQLFLAGSNTDISTDAKSVKWFVQLNGTGTPVALNAGVSDGVTTTDYIIPASGVKTLTIRTNLLQANTSLTYICEMIYTDTSTGFDVTTKSEIEIVRMTNGANTITAVLSNDSHTVPANADGSGGIYTGATTKLTIFNGATDDTANWTIAQARTTGLTVTEATTSRDATVTAMTNALDVGTVTFTATRAGFPTQTRVFTITKSKQGITPIAYWLNVDASAIARSVANIFSPSSINASGWQQSGISAPSTFAGRFTFATSTNMTAWTVQFTSSTNEATRAYTVPTGISSLRGIRVRLHQAGVTPSDANVIDEQIIPIVFDGAQGIDGVSAIIPVVWTPDGNTIRNDEGTATAQLDVYEGGSLVATTAHKWYIKDPSATTSVGGDVEGGAGWRLLQNLPTATTAPTTLATGTGNTLTAGTYFVRYTWVSPMGETTSSTESAGRAITLGQLLRITVPAFPTGVTGAKIYIGTATGVANARYQGMITATGTALDITSPINTASPLISTVAINDITGHTTSKITVSARSITGVASFKCIATYNSVRYSGVTSIVDLSDPIAVIIQGVDVFKNGQGSTTLTAKLYRAGLELDESGTQYNYIWHLYNSDNSKSMTFGGSGTMSGKTVTVLASDINVRGNIICEVKLRY